MLLTNNIPGKLALIMKKSSEDRVAAELDTPEADAGCGGCEVGEGWGSCEAGAGCGGCEAGAEVDGWAVACVEVDGVSSAS